MIDDFKSPSQHRHQQIWQGNYEIETGNNRALRKPRGGFVELIPVDESEVEIQKQEIAYASGVRFLDMASSSSVMGTLIHVGKG